MPPLTPTVFHILLALVSQERHGYEIMKQAEHDSAGSIRLGPGSLYGALKHLTEKGWIEESDERPVPERDDERRRYFRLTESGRTALGAEIARFEKMAALGRRRGPGLPNGLSAAL
jgi:DNA-binding PadR family transcriptional regulator